jgi:hypothetical protein
MHGYRWTVGLAAIAAVSACNPFHRSVQVNRDVNYNQRWHGTLTSPGYLAGAVQISGTASMAPGTDGSQTTVTVNVSNATPGGLHPWEVHRGHCGQSDLGIFGVLDSYKPVKIGGDGRGMASVVMEIPTPTNGEFFVLLHASPTNRETVIGCGNLAPPAP